MSDESQRDRSLERALVANLLIHALAMISMAALLLPALPGGSTADDLTRVERIAAAPLAFRLGWVPWQLAAACDLWMAIAMARARWLPRLATTFVLVATIAAVVPDQLAQARWVTEGVAMAREVHDPESLARYLAFERSTFELTAGWGALFYTLGGLGWTLAFARGKAWSRALSILSVPLWLVMAVAVVSPLLPAGMRPRATFVSGANGVGFTLLLVWLALVTEAVLARRRPTSEVGRLAPFRHPSRSLFGRAVDVVAESRLAAALLEPLPVFSMASDITDVVYVSYVIDAAAAERWVPEGLELERLGPRKDLALFTFLTYRHGHFGFRFLGPLRKLSPSAIQTNWRIHVRNPRTGRRGIFFVTNAITSTAQALGARLFTEGMPMHVIHRASIDRDVGSGRVRVEVDPGQGSAPDLRLDLLPAETPELEGPFREAFGTFAAFLAYCVPQNRAMSTEPYVDRATRHEIELPIPLDACTPMTGTVTSRRARDFVGDARPISFHVDGLPFRFVEEVHEPLS